MRSNCCLIGMACLLILAGCSSAPDTVEVNGALQIAGQPLDDISIQFVPDSANQEIGWKASGVTDASGKFTLRCEDGRPGAVPGHYRVMLDDLKVYANPRNNVPSQDRGRLIVSRVPKRYRSTSSTPLKIEVEAKSQPITLEVKE
ncbi:MAG: hypothetical protein K8T91_04540 [Planctomycetes bacterium]|nr:hypothetical protein [Planctomycetota bacterium]